MSISKISETEWEREFATGEKNDFHSITATAEGLEIDYDVIPWGEIDRARDFLKSRQSGIGPST